MYEIKHWNQVPASIKAGDIFESIDFTEYQLAHLGKQWRIQRGTVPASEHPKGIATDVIRFVSEKGQN